MADVGTRSAGTAPAAACWGDFGHGRTAAAENGGQDAAILPEVLILS